MIKWHCFKVEKIGRRIVRVNYIPSALKNSAIITECDDTEALMERLVSGVSVFKNAFKNATLCAVYVPGHCIHTRTAREAFEAAEKVFASVHPELYLQSIMNEDRRSC